MQIGLGPVAADLFDPVAAPARLEAVPFPLDLDVGAVTVDRVRRAQVVHGHQQVEVRLRLVQEVRSGQVGTVSTPHSHQQAHMKPL